jgi:hypothetical protein
LPCSTRRGPGAFVDGEFERNARLLREAGIKPE